MRAVLLVGALVLVPPRAARACDDAWEYAEVQITEIDPVRLEPDPVFPTRWFVVQDVHATSFLDDLFGGGGDAPADL